MKKEVIRFTDREVPWPRAVKVGNWIFMALANSTGSSFEEQLAGLLEEIKTTLESLGSSMGNIAKTTVYFVNLERDFDKAGAIWQKYFPSDNPPAVAWIGIKELASPSVLVEITLSAIIPDE